MPARPARVLVLIGQLGYGGAERQVHELCARLDRASFDPTVVTFEKGGHYQRALEDAGVRVIVVPKAGWREPASLARLVSILTRHRIDLIHGFLFPANWRAVVAARFAGVRAVVCAVRSTGIWMNARHRWMDRVALGRASVVVANAPAVREELIARTGLAGERVKVIMNGVDTSRFSPGESSLLPSLVPDAGGGNGRSPTRVVGFVGSLREAKDPVLFLRIAHETARRVPQARFVMVGEGPLRDRLESLSREMGLSGKVVFSGGRADIPHVLRALDVLTVTSIREGCCNVILEAMATGLPVVATAVGGNPDLLSHGQTGWLFPHGDPAAGAEGVVRLLEDRDLARQMGQEALRRARASFSIDAMVRSTAMLYESLL